MALNDCMRKLGKALGKKDRAALEQYIADGLTDDEAVRALLVEADNDIIDITKRAKKAGAKVATKPNVLAEIRSFSEAQVETVSENLRMLRGEAKELESTSQDINFVRDIIKRDFTDDGQGIIDINDAAAVQRRISAMFFKNPKLFIEGRLAGDLIKGSSPLQAFQSWEKMLTLQAETRAKLRELLVEEVALIEQTERLTGKRVPRGTYFQGKRGAITFDEMRRGVIKLTEAKDKSTFIHEAGHLYLEVFRSLAEDMGAPKQLQNDWRKILKYLGVKSGDEIGTKQHELFAKTFERYAMEGKAPSIDMQDAFSEFRVWLLAIYRRIRSMASMPLPPEITGVFDRMLASDEAIAEAEAVQEYAAVFVSPEAFDITPESYKLYRRSHIRTHNEAVDKETAKVLADMEREEKKVWKDAFKEVRFDVQEEANQMPVFRALAMLQRGTYPDGSPTPMAPFKLDKASIVSAMRGDTEILKKLPGGTGKFGVYRLEGGVDIDVAAPIFGFKSGLELIDALLKAPKMAPWIEAEARARMRERFPDPALDGTLTERAVRTAHTERRAEVIAFEMRKLRQLVRQDKPIVSATKKAIKRETREARQANQGILPKRAELAGIKRAARIAIGKRKIRNVKPHEYLRSERKAGRLAFQAANRGDFAEAYEYKRQQINWFEMYRAATAAKKQTDSAQKYLATFQGVRKRKQIGRSDLLEDIDAVLEGVDLKRKSLAQVDRENAMNRLQEAVKDGRMVVTPETLSKIMDESVNWQELTVSEFTEMRDIVKQLETRAKREVEMMVNGEKVLLANVGQEISKSLYDNNEIKDAGIGKELGKAGVKRGWQRGINAWLRSSSIARALDRSDWGAVTRNIIIPMRRAYAERLIPNLHKAQSDVAQIFKKHYSKEEMGDLSKKDILVDAQAETFSKQDIIGLALNWGNESNRNAVRGGVKRDGQVAFTEAGIKQMLSNMTEKDWLFVQDIWDYYESYWPALSAAERRRRGVSPERIEPTAFTIRTADGQDVELRGGYAPLAYDHRHSDRAKQHDIDDIYKKIQHGVFISNSTRAGATYERTSNGGKVVRLDLNIIDTHLREIVRDIAIGDEVTYIAKVLNRKDVRDAFNRTDNAAALDALGFWLTDAAVGELPAEGPVEFALSWVRTGFTKSRLAYNALVVALQFTGAAQSMAMIGSTHYAKGLGKFMSNPVNQWQEVMDKSTFLNTRYVVGTWDKDVQDTKAHLDSVFGPAPTRSKAAMTAVSHTYFWPIMKAQQVVDVTTWLASYEKGVSTKGLSDADAVLFADSMVEASQTSGFFSDRSGLERGTLGSRKNRQSQFIRIWTTLISYMLAKGNIAYEKTHNTSFKDPKQIAGWAADMVLLFTVEGILSAILYDRWPEESDDPEDYLLWAAAMTGESVVSGIPFVREVPGARFAGGNTPLGALAVDSYKFIQQSMEGELDDAWRRSFIRTAGTIGHLPSTQTNRVLDTLWAEDDEVELYNYIIGPPRDKK